MEFNDGWRLKCKVQKQFPNLLRKILKLLYNSQLVHYILIIMFTHENYEFGDIIFKHNVSSK